MAASRELDNYQFSEPLLMSAIVAQIAAFAGCKSNAQLMKNVTCIRLKHLVNFATPFAETIIADSSELISVF